MLTLTFFCVKLKIVKYQVCNCETGIAELIQPLGVFSDCFDSVFCLILIRLNSAQILEE